MDANRRPLPKRLLLPHRWPTWLAVGLLYLFGKLPRRWRVALGGRLGSRLFAGSSKRREIVAVNLSWCFPWLEVWKRQRLAEKFARRLGRTYLEFSWFWWAKRDDYLKQVCFDGLQAVESMLVRGERVIVVTVHNLAMDIGGTALSMRLPLTTFANEFRNPVLDWLVANRRGRFGCVIHRRSDGIRPVVRELKAGRVIFFPADEDQGAKQAETLFAPFFGVAKSTLTSPLRLARLAGAHVVPCGTYYDEEKGCYRVKLFPPIEFDGEELADGARALSKAFERVIREVPADYLWSQRLFTSRPDGGPAPYTMKGRPGSGPRPRPETLTQ